MPLNRYREPIRGSGGTGPGTAARAISRRSRLAPFIGAAGISVPDPFDKRRRIRTELARATNGLALSRQDITGTLRIRPTDGIITLRASFDEQLVFLQLLLLSLGEDGDAGPTVQVAKSLLRRFNPGSPLLTYP